MILAPLSTKSEEPRVLKSPWIRVPGSIVSVLPDVTWMKPLSVYTLPRVHVVLVVMSAVTSTLPGLLEVMSSSLV